MTTESEFKKFDADVLKFDSDTLKTNQSLVKLTKWIVVLTIVMICIGGIQLLVMWPKRTYCFETQAKVQICEPDYFPYDANPSDFAYKIDHLNSGL